MSVAILSYYSTCKNQKNEIKDFELSVSFLATTWPIHFPLSSKNPASPLPLLVNCLVLHSCIQIVQSICGKVFASLKLILLPLHLHLQCFHFRYTLLLEYFAGEKPLRMSQIIIKVDPLRSAFWQRSCVFTIYKIGFADFIVAN